MKFVRKKKRGQNQKVRRTWFSEEGYRIVWRKEVYGVRVPARFQATVRVLVPYSDGQLRQMWDFVNRNRRLTKTLKAAEEECEKHNRLWTRVCEATGIRALKELFGGKLPLGLPVWARKKLDRRLYAILIDNRPMKHRNDEEDESRTESLPQSSDTPGPGGPAITSDSFVSLTAQAPAAGRKKPAAKRSKRSSRHTAKRRRSTTDSPASDAKPLKRTRKMRPLSCGSQESADG